MEEIIRLQNYEPFWGEWRVTSLLHEGSISNIYHVENESSKGIVKVIPIPKVQNDFRNSSRSLEDTEAMHGFCKEVVEVLQEELERIRCLDSIPNILGYRKYEVFERKEEVGYDIVLLMDEEQNLADYAAERDIQNEEIVKIVKDVAWILEKAHQEGILHKNIKVENIFITETGESMLADFSLTRKIESFQSRNQRKGNNVYTAPEVLSEYDFSELTDVYALGVVLYLLLNNCEMPPVFENRDARTEIPKPERAGEKLSEIVMKAIAYRAKDRYQSAEEFFKALYGLKEKDFALPAAYAEAEKRKKEQRQKAELERQKQEEEKRRRQEELAQEEERKRQEEAAKEEEKRRQEELAREEERKRQEEAAKEEEKRRQEELAREEERKRQEEAAKEEEKRRQEELTKEKAAKEEEERKRQEELAREEERRRQEELAREEEERRKQQELLRIEAEQERRRIAEEKMARERQKDESVPVSPETLFFEEETLGGAASQLHSSMKQMEQMAENAQSEIRKEERVYDRDAEPVATFTNYSMSEEKEELIDEIIASVSAEQRERQSEATGHMDNKTLLETLAAQKDGEPDVKLHSDKTEYGGFFDFTKEAYQEQKQEVLYDKNMDEEPFEQKMANFPKETKSKKPIIILLFIVLMIAGCIYLFQNPQIRKGIQDTYDSAIAYFSEQVLE